MENSLQATIDAVYQSCTQHPGTLVTYQTDDIRLIIEGLGGVKKESGTKTTEKKTKKEN